MTLSLASGGLSWLDKGGLAGLRRGRTAGRRPGADPEDHAMLMRDLADRNAENIAQRTAGGNVVYSGVPGQFRRTPGGPSPITQDQILATARTAAAGAQLGTPESYGKQGPLTVGDVTKARQQGQVMGAEGEPIEVIRRLGVTHQGPNTGEEYGTVGQARQAMRRDIGVGEYVSPEMDKAAGKINPQLMKISQDNFSDFMRQYATVNPDTGEAKTPDIIEKKARDLLPTITSPETGQSAMAEITKVKADHDLLTSSGARKTMIDNLNAEVKRIEAQMGTDISVDDNTKKWYQAAPRIRKVIESGDYPAEHYPGLRDLLNMKRPETGVPGKTEQTATPGQAEGDQALKNYAAIGKAVGPVLNLPREAIERGAEGIGSLVVQGLRNFVPGASGVFGEPTPEKPLGATNQEALKAYNRGFRSVAPGASRYIAPSGGPTDKSIGQDILDAIGKLDIEALRKDRKSKKPSAM